MQLLPRHPKGLAHPKNCVKRDELSALVQSSSDRQALHCATRADSSHREAWWHPHEHIVNLWESHNAKCYQFLTQTLPLHLKCTHHHKSLCGMQKYVPCPFQLQQRRANRNNKQSMVKKQHFNCFMHLQHVQTTLRCHNNVLTCTCTVAVSCVLKVQVGLLCCY